jgi:hypothetical protein
VGLLTVDVNPLGVVIASDSQPVALYADRVELPASGARVRSPILRTTLEGFSGFMGYVGTEQLDGKAAREWLHNALQQRAGARLSDLSSELAEVLTQIWTTEGIATHLSLFVAGYERDEPRFWFISNGEVPDGSSSTVSSRFEAVDDLDSRFIQVNARPGESTQEVVARLQPSFRRGVLSAAAIFDSFTALISRTIQQGHPQIPPIDALDRYAAYARFRFEFTKRMYDPKYGMGVDPHPPVAGTIHVFSVDPAGTARAHGKHLKDARVVP